MSAAERLRGAVADSRLAGALGVDAGTVPDDGTVADGSVVLRLRTAVATTLADASDRSAVDRLARRLATVASESFAYRWLTSDPDPDVVVVDLRETLTIGPVLAGLDRLAAWLGPRWRASGTGRVTRWLAATLGPAAENASVTDALAELLAPPAPDERRPREPRPSDDG